MFALFLFALFSHEEIPPELRELADRALANSLNKFPKEIRQNTEYPGEFSFPDLRFTLKKTLSCPISRDIKGYAIDDNKIAIVKRKAFNIRGEFAFVDPPTQNIYEMKKIIASDDKVNIYETIPLTIFDIMTNFHLHKKTTRKIAPNIDINWDTYNDEPKTTTVKGIGGFEIGLGASGKLALDLNINFKTKLDCSIKGNAEIDMKVALLAKLFDKTEGESDEEFDLYEFPGYKINDLSQSYNFLFIKFEVETFIKASLHIEDIRITVPNSIEFFKGYRFVGFKYIEISSFNVIDSDWFLIPYHLQERNSLKEVLDAISSASLSFTPNIRLYFSIELNLANLISQLDFGLKFPFKMTFGFNSDKCLLPYLFGNLAIGINMFYHFDGIKYKIFTKEIKLIDESDGELEVLEFGTNDFCIGEPSQVVEGSSAVLQRDYDTSYFVENGDFYWNSNNNENPLKLGINALVNGNVAAFKSTSYTSFSASSSSKTKVNTHLIVTTNTKPVISWYTIKNVKKTYTKKVYIIKPIVYKKYTYTYYEDEISAKDSYNVNDDQKLIKQYYSPKIAYGSGVLTGNATIWTCRDIKLNKVFQREQDSIVVTNIPCDGAEYVLVALNEDGSTKIDDKAKFYAESMTTEDLSFEGIYKADKNHYEVTYYQFHIDRKMRVSLSLTLQTTRNGANKNESFGGFTATFGSTGTFTPQQAGIEAQNLKFYARSDNNPIIYHQTEMVVENDDESQDSMTTYIGSIDTGTINSFANGNVDCEMSYTGISTKFMLRIRYIDSPLVSIKSGLGKTPDEEILTKLFRHTITSVNSKISISFAKDELYKAIRFEASSDVPLSTSYLIIKSNLLTPLMGNMLKISDDIYCIKCTGNVVNVPIRRQNIEAETITFQYLVSDLNNPADVNMNSLGESVQFTSTKQPKAFVAIRINGEYDFFYSTTAKLTFNTMDIDDNHQLVSILSNTVTTVKFVNRHIIFEEKKISVTYDTSHIEPLLAANAKMPIKVICKTSDVRAIRCGNQVSNLVNNVAEFQLSPTPDHQVVFYTICKDGTGIMCEISLTPTEGEYQLLNLKNKDGLNITGRGMGTAIVHAPKGLSLGYYKGYSDEIQIVRSYGNSIKAKLVVEDEFPNSKMLELVYGRDLEGATRKFCVYDEDENGIPFSTKFLQEGLDTFIKSAGFNKSEIVDYEVLNDNCLVFELKDFEKNVFVSFPPNALDINVEGDMEVNSEGILYDPEFIPPTETPTASQSPTASQLPPKTPAPTKSNQKPGEPTNDDDDDDDNSHIHDVIVGSDFNSTDDGENDENNNNNKKKFTLSKKMILIIACAAGGVVVVAIIIVIVVVTIHKKKTVYSSDPEIEMVNYSFPTENNNELEDLEEKPSKKDKNKKKDGGEAKVDNSYAVGQFG